MSAVVNEYIKGCENFDDAVDKLKAVYIKNSKAIFARQQLATKNQQPGETLEEFFASPFIC